MFNRIRRSLKALRCSTSGNATLLVALGMPALIGGAGLAVDTAQWYMWKRELQFAADQAALAGAWARTETDTESLYAQRAVQELNANLSTTADIVNTPAVSIEDWGDGNDNSILVTVSATKKLAFSSFLTGESTTVFVSAQASFGDARTYSACILATNEDAEGAIIIQGNVTLAQSCGIAALSTSEEAITLNGSTADPGTGELTARGGIDDGFNNIDGLAVNEWVDELYDPYQDLEAPIDNTPQEYACVDIFEEIGTTYARQTWTSSATRKQKYTSTSPAAPNAGATWVETSDAVYPDIVDGPKTTAGIDVVPTGYAVGTTYTTRGSYSWSSASGPVTSTTTTTVKNVPVTTTTYTWTRQGTGTDSNLLYARVGKSKNAIGQLATLHPGTYTGGFTVRCNTNLVGGIYVIDGGTLRINSNHLVTSTAGVMIVLRNGATIDINGGAGVSLRPMSKSELDAAIAGGTDIEAGSDTELLAGMLVMEETGNRESLVDSTINGTAGLTLNGTLYLPGTQLDLSGTAGVSSQCLMIAASTIRFSGNMVFTSLCPSEQTQTAGTAIGTDPGGVKLVA